MTSLNSTSDLWHVRLKEGHAFEIGPLCCWNWFWCWWYQRNTSYKRSYSNDKDEIELYTSILDYAHILAGSIKFEVRGECRLRKEGDNARFKIRTLF